MWNGVYTLPHTLLYTLDRCAPRVVLERFPSLYNLTRKGMDLNFKELFFSYLLRGILQSIFLLWLVSNIFDSTFVFAQGGETISSETSFCAAYTSILFSQIIVIYTESNSITILNLLIMIILPFFYTLATFVYSEHYFHTHFEVFLQTFRPQYIIAVAVITIALTMPWIILKCLRDIFQINRRNILRAEMLAKYKLLLKSEDACHTKLKVWLYRLMGFFPEPASLVFDDSISALSTKEKNRDL
ncbi:unnamed protein product [Phytomonas sp. Hart1]|nr:unnamed protein product [Phytomonas sp. Hart1]|eukprot:CCW68093.1 unnamed protein product [Phytomonas sp. isolate Hart1]